MATVVPRGPTESVPCASEGERGHRLPLGSLGCSGCLLSQHHPMQPPSPSGAPTGSDSKRVLVAVAAGTVVYPESILEEKQKYMKPDLLLIWKASLGISFLVCETGRTSAFWGYCGMSLPVLRTGSAILASQIISNSSGAT